MRLTLPKTKGMLRREAAAWLVRLQSGRDPDIERKFRRWLDGDPAHAAAFGRVRQSYDRAAVLRHSKRAFATPALARERPHEPRFAWAAAAALVLLVAGCLYLRGGSILGPTGTEAVMLTTNVGEIRQVRLADGTRLTLDTATSVEVEVEVGRSLRRALIKTGRARFDLAPADAPFVIETGNTTVTAGSGVLDVEKLDGQSTVDVLAGNADVRSAAGPRNNAVGLTAGEGAILVSGGPVRKHSLGVSDWTRGMLEFDGTPLAAAVALANRYSEQKIVLEAGLGELRVTGAFRAGDVTAFATALAEAFHLSVMRNEKGNLILSHQRAAARSN